MWFISKNFYYTLRILLTRYTTSTEKSIKSLTFIRKQQWIKIKFVTWRNKSKIFRCGNVDYNDIIKKFPKIKSRQINF